MIWVIAYFIVALVSAPFIARALAADRSNIVPLEGGDYVVAGLLGLVFGALWPIVLATLLVTRIAFPRLSTKREDHAE